MRLRLLASLAAAFFAVAPLALAQSQPSTPAPQPADPAQLQPAQTAPPTPPAATTPQPVPPPPVPATEPPPVAPADQATSPVLNAPPSDQPSILSRAASGTYDRRDTLPNVNIYLPEGQASVRLRKLIRNVLFESQIDYRFVNGDISTYLRYKYYARNFTYRLGVFDTIGFPDLGKTSTKEFERVRGGLLLFELPRDYNNRYFWLLQDDRLTFGQVSDVDNRKNNIYTKIGYQYGTQFDERMNGIVGESRGRIVPVLTAFRDLGPQRFSFAAAVTESGKLGPGDYQYTKLESEALRRTDLTATSFIVSRAHLGVFLTRKTVTPLPGQVLDPIERYSIPRYEMFRLGGREALRAIGDNVKTEGTHELHTTHEYFVPIFRNKDFRSWLIHWNTMYGIGYLGAGSVAFDYKDLKHNGVVDAGLGTETSLTIRDFEVLLSVVYARTLHAPDGFKGSKVRFSIRTIR
jgi:hypothetical protein